MNNNYLVTIRLDYLFHAVLYIPWIILVWLGFSKTIRTSAVGIAGWVLFSILFAMAMEGVQYFLPYRTYNINDLLSNLIGVGSGYVAVGSWQSAVGNRLARRDA